jgi:hypothetical protein
MVAVKKLLGLATLCLTTSLITCSPPPFNLEISGSAKTAKKLTLVGQVGPLNSSSISLGSQGSEDVVFIPEKDGMGGITLQSGFVYSFSSNGQQATFISNTGGQGNYASCGSMFLGQLSTDPYPDTMFQSVKSLHNAIIFQFQDTNPLNNSYSIATGIVSPASFALSTGPAALNPFVQGGPFGGAAKYVVGLSIYPDPSVALDRTYWLMRNQANDHYREGLFDISQNPLPAGSIVRPGPPNSYDLSPFVGSGANRMLYYYDPLSNRSYVSIWNSPLSPGNWSTWVWIDNVPTYWQLSSIGNRIDDLLTTGELFSTQSNTGCVYDPTTPTGTLESTFPLGDLRFIGEVYVGGTPTVLFSEALWYNQQVTFNVYSIPTAQLKSLGQ